MIELYERSRIQIFQEALAHESGTAPLFGGGACGGGGGGVFPGCHGDQSLDRVQRNVSRLDSADAAATLVHPVNVIHVLQTTYMFAKNH